MADITVQLVSVDRMIWTGEASIVTAQTTEGEIGILPGHEPILGQLKDNGVVTINPLDGERIVAAVQEASSLWWVTRSPSWLTGQLSRAR